MPPLPALPPDLLEEGGPISVYLAPDPDHFTRLAGGRVPEWSAGIAIPERRRIVLPIYTRSSQRVHDLWKALHHELAHIALHSYLAPQRPPRWFDEGYAQWAAGDWGWEAGWQLRLAFALNRAPPLDSISLDWPRRRADAGIAYLLAFTTVTYLLEHGGGERGLTIFLERWRSSGSLESALRSTYGLTLAQFEHEWLQDVENRYGWALLLTHSITFWTPLGLIVLLMTIRKRRDLLRRIEELRAIEPPDSPAYWLEMEGEEIEWPEERDEDSEWREG